MTRKEQEELAMIKSNISVDLINRQVNFKYTFIRDVNLLHDNRRQAIAIDTKLESRLKAKQELIDYNKEIRDFLDRGVLRELSNHELESWEGPVNYISHHGVLKPGSATTKLRVVSNSSLDNNNSGLSLNDCLPKVPNTLVPLIQLTVAWRSYQHCVVWDLSKAYNVVHTTDKELHLRRLVRRWGDDQDDWLTFGLTQMHFGDRCAMCNLEVAKAKVADLGQDINPEAVAMIKMTYVDDGAGGGSKETFDRLIGEETSDKEGNLSYSGTVAQIFALGGFTIKVMVWDGESRSPIIDKLGGGVLGLEWDPVSDYINMHLAVNLSLKKANIRLGPEITLDDLSQLSEIPLTKRIGISQINTIYDPLGLLAPLTIRYKLTLQKIAGLSLG